MSLNIGIIMDPVEKINIKKDTTFALMLEAQQRGWNIFYLQPQDIWMQNGLTWGKMSAITVRDQLPDYYELTETHSQPLTELDVLFMRKDPPFDMEYVYCTYLLEQAQAKGVLVVNNPTSLRDANEKLFASWFPQCCPKTLVSAKKETLIDFANNEKDIVIKPLDGMGGKSIFRVEPDSPNLNVIIDTLTEGEKQFVMAQRYIPEITHGDKRILLIEGKPVPHALARIPKEGDFRGNLAQGASAQGRELTDHDLWICEQVGPTLRD